MIQGTQERYSPHKIVILLLSRNHWWFLLVCVQVGIVLLLISKSSVFWDGKASELGTQTTNLAKKEKRSTPLQQKHKNIMRKALPWSQNIQAKEVTAIEKSHHRWIGDMANSLISFLKMLFSYSNSEYFVSFKQSGIKVNNHVSNRLTKLKTKGQVIL